MFPRYSSSLAELLLGVSHTAASGSVQVKRKIGNLTHSGVAKECDEGGSLVVSLMGKCSPMCGGTPRAHV